MNDKIQKYLSQYNQLYGSQIYVNPSNKKNKVSSTNKEQPLQKYLDSIKNKVLMVDKDNQELVKLLKKILRKAK
mgnify:CR=1 FL=1